MITDATLLIKNTKDPSSSLTRTTFNKTIGCIQIHPQKTMHYDELHSPSTDYTEPETLLCETHDMFGQNSFVNGSDSLFSAKFLNEVSSFEPLGESVDPFSLTRKPDLKCNTLEDDEKSGGNLLTEKKCTEEPVDPGMMEQDTDDESNEEGWSKKRERVLRNMALKCKHDWKKISKRFNEQENTDYSPVFLQQKYKELDKVPIPLRVKFTPHEDLMLAKYFNIYGCDWTRIATHFADRTAMMLKNRYYSYIRKRDLLATMLKELNEPEAKTPIGKNCEKEEEKEHREEDSIEEEDTNEDSDDDETIKIFVENRGRFLMRRLPINHSMNVICLEVEEALANELHDRITL